VDAEPESEHINVGIIEQTAPATQTRFGVPGRKKQAPMPSAATACENSDAIQTCPFQWEAR